MKKLTKDMVNRTYEVQAGDMWELAHAVRFNANAKTFQEAVVMNCRQGLSNGAMDIPGSIERIKRAARLLDALGNADLDL